MSAYVGVLNNTMGFYIWNSSQFSAAIVDDAGCQYLLSRILWHFVWWKGFHWRNLQSRSHNLLFRGYRALCQEVNRPTTVDIRNGARHNFTGIYAFMEYKETTFFFPKDNSVSPRIHSYSGTKCFLYLSLIWFLSLFTFFRSSFHSFFLVFLICFLLCFPKEC